jgi:hypothetical protein
MPDVLSFDDARKRRDRSRKPPCLVPRVGRTLFRIPRCAALDFGHQVRAATLLVQFGEWWLRHLDGTGEAMPPGKLHAAASQFLAKMTGTGDGPVERLLEPTGTSRDRD